MTGTKLTAEERRHFLLQLENNKLFWEVMEKVDDFWFQKFDNCDVNKPLERDYYHTAMKSVKYVKKSILDQLQIVKNKID
jgi:hypothetical protein